MKVVAFVPIKLNSVRVPNKNILPLNGKPLCTYIMDTLLAVEGIDEIYVFCSSEEIKEYLPEGIKFLKRSSKLDENLTKGEEIYTAFAKEIKADIYMLVHTTSPFLKADTVSRGLKKVLDGTNDSAFSAQKIQTFAWYQGKPLNYELEDIPRTQDIEPVWIETSGFYIYKRELFEEYKRRIGFSPFICQVTPVEAIDIDVKEDWEFAEAIAKIEEGI